MGSNYGPDRGFSSGRVKVRRGFVSDVEVVAGGFMDTGGRRGKESSSVKDGSKVSGLVRRSESRRVSTEPKAGDISYLFSVIVINTGGGEGCFVVILKWREFMNSDRGRNGLWRTTKGFSMSHEELSRCTEFEYFI